MGDRTWGQFTVVQLDTEKYPEEAAAILAVIEDTGLAWLGACDADPHKVLQVGPDAQYGDDQVSCGFVGEYLVPLVDLAPHAVFYGYEGGGYEWLGEAMKYHPNLGLWRQSCDDNGNAVYSRDEVLNFIKLSKVELERRIHYLLGIPWGDTINELSARLRAEQQEASNG
jgi:hypothetical protein